MLDYSIPIIAFIALTSVSVLLNIYFYLKLKEASFKASYLEKENLNNKELQAKLDKLLEEKFELQSALELQIQKNSQLQNLMVDFEKNKQEATQSAKAALFEAGTLLSNKLFAEHKRETEEAKQQNEAHIKKTTEELYAQFQNILHNVSHLNKKVVESNSAVDLIKKALLTPSGAGAIAEITLENILKASGLIKNQDFYMQYSISNFLENIKLRPDAVIFLPSDNLMIIDSKASKFFVEAEMEQDIESKENILAKLKQSIRQHLKDLSSKDYRTAISKNLRKVRNEQSLNFVTAIMFLPSDAAADKIRHLDPELFDKAWEANIFPVGPSGLINILTHAKFMIQDVKAHENQLIINEEIKKLLHSIATLYEYIKKIGNNIHSAASNYDKLAGCFNGNIVPRTRNINKLGVDHATSLNMLDRYQIVSSSNLIEVVEKDLIVSE